MQNTIGSLKEMNVYVIIPVFNRLEHTVAILDCLNRQTCRELLKIIVINDGSTDGTAEFLASQDWVTVINGNGSLWWSGATNVGLVHAFDSWRENDFVLFLNNDLQFDQGYIESMVILARQNPNTAIGSALFDINEKNKLMALGPKLNNKTQEIYEIADSFSKADLEKLAPIYEVDALTGRGALYSVRFFEKYGLLKQSLLPHYFADYEISMRFKRNGVKLLISTSSRVYSEPIFGYLFESMSFNEIFFSNRSQKKILHRMIFQYLTSCGSGKLKMPIKSLYWSLREIASYFFWTLKRSQK
jgi:GT2 family glycosyltransferase